MNIPADLKYTESHEWVRPEADGTLTVGITEYAQDALGDIVFVELPQVGKTFTAGDDAAVVESVKAASDIYAPVSGTVIAVNQAVADAPDSINTDAYAPGCSSCSRPTRTPSTACSTRPPTASRPTADPLFISRPVRRVRLEHTGPRRAGIPGMPFRRLAHRASRRPAGSRTARNTIFFAPS